MNMAHDLSRVEGLWILQPEACRYALGQPPKSGRYRIKQLMDDALFLESEWVSRSRRVHALQFTGVLDGRPHPLSGSRIADAIQLEYISTLQLNSSAWREGRKVMWAERMLTLPDTLQIDVYGYLAVASVYRNIDVYQRASGQT